MLAKMQYHAANNGGGRVGDVPHVLHPTAPPPSLWPTLITDAPDAYEFSPPLLSPLPPDERVNNHVAPHQSPLSQVAPVAMARSDRGQTLFGAAAARIPRSQPAYHALLAIPLDARARTHVAPVSLSVSCEGK
jgi:hypothetical protein